MKKITLSLVIVIVLVVILFVLKGQVSNAPQQASPTPTTTPLPSATPKTSSVLPHTYLIKITDQGISPQNLNIKLGDTVTFTNLDLVPHWPASGSHPTHQICQGFDALKGLSQNESYSYKFMEAKTCPFHDHLNTNSKYFGKITVSD